MMVAKSYLARWPSLMMINNKTDLSAFNARGGKLIVWGGMGDATSSFHDTARWYEALTQASSGPATDYARLFAVPGLAHCGGGVATDSFDMLDTVVRWVEVGEAPDRIVATASKPALFGTERRTRPLCAYPRYAHYNGSGDVDDAASFSCR